MKPIRVLFFPYPVPSHVNAFWGISHTLAKQGHHCNFAVQDTLPHFLIGQLPGKAIEFNSLNFGVGFEGPLAKLEKSSDVYLDNLIARITSRIYLDRKEKLFALLAHLEHIDVILLDAFLFSDFIILYPYLKQKGVKLFFVQTMFPFLHPQGNCPPLTSTCNPETYTQWQKAKDVGRQYFNRLTRKVKYLNFDDPSLLSRKMKENGVPAKFSLRMNTAFCPAFTNIPELILAPEYLEFPNLGQHDWQHYTEK